MSYLENNKIASNFIYQDHLYMGIMNNSNQQISKCPLSDLLNCDSILFTQENIFLESIGGAFTFHIDYEISIQTQVFTSSE